MILGGAGENTKKMERTEHLISYIELIFENCDTLELSGNDVYGIHVDIKAKYIDDGNFTWEASKVNLCIRLDQLNISKFAELQRKDISRIKISYKPLAVPNEEFVVPYPCYLNSWLPNPYQNNFIWKSDGKKYMDIDIEPHWSLLSLKQAVIDYVGMMFRDFPNGMLLLLSGYWSTFKRHFKWRH